MDKIELEMDQLAESLAKSAELEGEELEKAGKGPGSRGGKVIGHTRSGKPIYDSHDHPGHAGFNSMDHSDAIKAHHSHVTDVKAGKKGERLHLFHEADDSKELTPKRRAEIAESRENQRKHVHSFHQKAISEEEAKGRPDMAELNRDRYEKAKESMHQEHAMKQMTKEEKAHHEGLISKRNEAASKRKASFDKHFPKHEESAEYKQAKGDHEAAHAAIGEHEKAIARKYGNPNPDKKPHEPIVEGVKATGEPIHAEPRKEKKMKKSEEVILDAVMTLGKEGLKKALPTLTEPQKELLKSVLEKARAEGSEGSVVLAAQEKAPVAKEHDEEDEKLVKPKNADHKNQGDDSVQPGQVIKAQMEPGQEQLQDAAQLQADRKRVEEKKEDKKMSKDAEKPFKKGEDYCEHDDELAKGFEHLVEGADLEKAYVGFDKLVDKLKQEKNPPADPDAVAAAIGRKKYGKKAFQSMSKSAPLCKSCESEEKKEGPKMSIKEKLKALAERKGLNKSQMIEAAKAAGNDVLVKAIEENWDESFEKGKKMPIAEEAKMEGESPKFEAKEQKEDKEKKKEAEKVAEVAGGGDAKPPKGELMEKKSMKKSVAWGEGTQRLLKANLRRGQNAHYDTVDQLEKAEKETAETLKKGGYLNEESCEELQKSLNSVAKKVTANDIIEKGLDITQAQIDRVQALTKSQPSQGSFNTKSFDDADILKSLGYTQEQADKILGNK